MTATSEAVGASGSTGNGNLLARFFLLRRRLEEARQREFVPSDQGWSEYLWARSAYEAADRFREVAGDLRATLLLLEQVMWLAAVATAKRAHGSEANLDADTLFQVVANSESIKANVGALSEADRMRLQRILSERCAGAATTTAESKNSDLRAQIQWLRPLAGRFLAEIDRDADVTHRVKRQRIARIGGAALLAVALVAVVVIVLARLLAPEPVNHALNKPVTCSSNEDPKQVPPQRLVDGDTSAVGAITRLQSRPWVQIDLGKPTPIQQVVVYHAASGKKRARGVPLMLEGSMNGKDWKRLGQRRKQFSVWEFAPKRPLKPVRYIRLKVRSKKAQLRLREVVVY